MYKGGRRGDKKRRGIHGIDIYGKRGCEGEGEILSEREAKEREKKRKGHTFPLKFRKAGYRREERERKK